MTDAEGLTTTYTYDALGRVIAETRPGFRGALLITSNEYNTANQLVATRTYVPRFIYFPLALGGTILVYYAPIIHQIEETTMVKIRMRRTGCRNHAAYRIVAADSRSPRDGKFIEILGWYDTQIKEDNFKIDLERVNYWLSKGAKPSETVASLIRRAKNPSLKPHHANKAKKAEKKA